MATLRPRLGWLDLILGAMVTGGTTVLFCIAFVDAECHHANTNWGDRRTFFCRDVMGASWHPRCHRWPPRR